MKCSNCGTENREGVGFCEECGNQIQAVSSENRIGNACPTCGHVNRSGIRFCEECGVDLSTLSQGKAELMGNVVCPKCKYINRAGILFCEECGSPLGMPQSAVSKTQQTSTPFWEKSYLLGGLAGGILLIFFLGAILILGPRQINPPPGNLNPIAETPYVSNPTNNTPNSAVQNNPNSVTEPSAEQPAQPSKPSTELNCTDRANLVTETIVAGTVYPSQTGFTKTWVVENTGTCTWTTKYTINFTSGAQMEAASSGSLQNEVQPNQRISITMDMVSPAESGTYQSEWILKNASGESFGWGSDANAAFEVYIKVDNEVVLAPDSGSIDPSLGANPPAVGGGPGGVIDTDGDGLEDWVEDWLANTFVPYVEYASGEDGKRDDIMRFYQVTPIYKTYPNMTLHSEYVFPGYDGPPGVLLTYVYTYKWDTGDPYIGALDHAGDAEMIRIFLVNPRNEPNFFIPATIIIHRHGLDPQFYFAGQFYGNTAQEWIDGNHLKIYASEDKHAMYVYKDECEDYAVGYVLLFEECGGGYSLDSPITPGVNGFNVGERLSHPFSRVPNNPRGLYTTEFVWSGTESMLPIYDASNNMKIVGTYDASKVFCGGFNELADFDLFGVGPNCGGGMHAKWWPSPDLSTQRSIEYLLGQFANRTYINRYEQQYEVCFLTGDMYNAGSDFHVDLTLVGTSSTLSWQKLFNVTRGLESLERSSFDCFKAGSYSMNDEIVGIQLHVYGDSDDASEWYLHGVVVTDRFTHKNWQFQCNCWIDNTNTYDSDIGQDTWGPDVNIPLSPITNAFTGGFPETTLTIVNNGDFPIFNVYYSVSTADYWSDLLDGAIYHGDSQTFSIPQGVYDIRIEGGVDKPVGVLFHEWWGVKILEPVTLTVTFPN